jgi:hypothetical protein
MERHGLLKSFVFHNYAVIACRQWVCDPYADVIGGTFHLSAGVIVCNNDRCISDDRAARVGNYNNEATAVLLRIKMAA